MKSISEATMKKLYVLGFMSCMSFPALADIELNHGVKLLDSEMVALGACAGAVTVDAVQEGDKKRVDFIMERQLMVSTSSGSDWATGQCQIKVPLSIPPNTQCLTSSLGIHANASLPQGGYAAVALRYRLGGMVKDAQILEFTEAGTSGKYVIDNQNLPATSCASGNTRVDLKANVDIITEKPLAATRETRAWFPDGATFVDTVLDCRPCN
jgi:hypothetical protein